MTPAAPASIEARASERSSESGRRNANNHRQCGRAANVARGDIDRLLRIKLGSFAQHTENGQSRAAARSIEVRQAINRVQIDPTIGVKRRRSNRVHPACAGNEPHRKNPF